MYRRCMDSHNEIEWPSLSAVRHCLTTTLRTMHGLLVGSINLDLFPTRSPAFFLLRTAYVTSNLPDAQPGITLSTVIPLMRLDQFTFSTKKMETDLINISFDLDQALGFERVP